MSTVMVTLDLSTTNTGVSIYEDGEYVNSNNIIPPKNMLINDRVKFVARVIKKIILEQKPDIIVCEDDNVYNNYKVASYLLKLIGVCQGYSYMTDAYFFDIASSSWRKQVAAYFGTAYPKNRKECKKWDIMMCKKYLREIKVRCPRKLDDNRADAILIGLAYKMMFSE